MVRSGGRGAVLAAMGLAAAMLAGAGLGGVACRPAPGGAQASPGASQPPPALAECIDRGLERVRARELRSDRHTPWVILHGVIAFEDALTVLDAAREERVPAIEFLLTRARHRGRPVFRVADGVPALPPRERYFQVQDHVDQWLMALADAGVSLERPLLAEGGRRFRVRDLLVAAQRGFRPHQELGWTLVAFSTWIPFDQVWSSDAGASYRVADLVTLAIRRDARRETEGGVHHLYGVAYALRRWRQAGGGASDPWSGAEAYLRRHVQLARRFQQADGAFSAAGFEGSVAPRTPRQEVGTTGHMLEWLALALGPAELRAAWVERAVTRLCTSLQEAPLESLSDGGIYHAAHALRLLREAGIGSDDPAGRLAAPTVME